MHPENETRMLSLYIKDDRDHTKDILTYLAEQAEGGSLGQPDLSSWHAVQTWLELGGARGVIIPYARLLAVNTSPASIRMRRDFGLILTLIKAHALLHQCQRGRDKAGNIVASIDDYDSVYGLLSDLISEASQVSVNATVRGTVNAVKELLKDKSEDASVSVRQLADHIQLDKSSASRRARVAANLGYLKNLEDKKGKPARYVLDDELPEDTPALPSPDKLRKLIREVPPEMHATVQHPPVASANCQEIPDDEAIPVGEEDKQGLSGKMLGRLPVLSPAEILNQSSSNETSNTEPISQQLTLDNFIRSAPYPDTSKPCYACGNMNWNTHPNGGGSYCGTCHPSPSHR